MGVKTEPVVYNVQLVGDSMLLRMSKFIQQRMVNPHRSTSRWQRHSRRSPLRSRSSSMPRRILGISEQGQAGGSLSDIASDSTSTSMESESPVSSSSLPHVKSRSVTRHIRFNDSSSPASIDKSSVNSKSSMTLSKAASTAPAEITPYKIASHLPAESPPYQVNKTPVSRLAISSTMTHSFRTPPPFSMYQTLEHLSKSAPPIENKEYVSKIPEVISLCVSGQTLLELYTLLKSLSSKRYVDMSQNVLLMCGTNDIKRRNTLESMERSMRKIVEALREIKHDVNITVLTLPPIPANTSKQQCSTLLQYNSFLREELEGVKVVDIHHLFISHEKITNSMFEEFLGSGNNQRKDGVHWNAKGMTAVHQHLINRGIFKN